MAKPSPFREGHEKRLTGLENLDTLLSVITPKSWLALAALCTFVIATLLWAALGCLPESVAGRGILLRKGGIHEIVSPTAGVAGGWRISVGDPLQKGQTLAEVRSADGKRTPIVATDSGTLLEIRTMEGASVSVGTHLAIFEPTQKPLVAVIYLPASEAKRVQVGMEARIETANARAEQYGLLLGRVRTISPYPTSEQRMMILLQNEALVRSLSAGGPVVETEITLAPDPATPSGYRWTSPQGLPNPITSGLLCTATLLVSEKTPLSFAFPHKGGKP